jgi:ribosomal protein S13
MVARAETRRTEADSVQLIEGLRRGRLTLRSALEAPEARELTVSELLQTRRYVGPQRAKRILLDAGIALDARCEDLDPRAVDRLAPREGTMALKAAIASGRVSLRTALTSTEAEAIRVDEVLLAMPNIARERARLVLAKAEISPGTRCGKLDREQVSRVVDAATPRSPRPSERRRRSGAYTDPPKVGAARRREVEPRTLDERLRVQAAERAELGRMSRVERRLAYELGELTAYQRSVWAANFFREATFKTRDGETVTITTSVPECGLINGELPWIVATLADYERD